MESDTLKGCRESMSIEIFGNGNGNGDGNEKSMRARALIRAFLKLCTRGGSRMSDQIVSWAITADELNMVKSILLPIPYLEEGCT